MTEQGFFNKQFFRNLFIAVISQMIVLVIAISVSTYVGGYLDRLTVLFESVDRALTSIERVVQTLDPEELASKAEAINGASQVIGDGVGDGGAVAVDKIGTAFDKFLKKDKIDE